MATPKELTAAVDSVGNTFSGVGDVVNDSKGRSGTIVAVLPTDQNVVYFQVRFTFAMGGESAHISEQRIVSTLLTVVSRADGLALSAPIASVTPERVLPTIGNTSEFLARPF